MRVVHKFLVPFASLERHGNPAPVLSIAVGAQIISVGMDPETGNPAVWVEVDQHPRLIGRRLVAYATGEKIPDDAKAIGTASCGVYRWHVYEQASPEGGLG